MKKIILFTLVMALMLSLAVCASATVVPHSEAYCGGSATLTDASNAVKAWAHTNSVVIMEKPDDLEQTWTSHKQAITAAELRAICDANEDISNLTVFRQRNVKTEGGDMTVRLWACNPAKKTNQSVVVLYRPEGGEWSVLANQFGQRECTVTLPAGEGAYVVCLGW